MKKLFLAGVFATLFLCGNSFAAEIPEFIRVGINASNLSDSITLSAEGGVYTDGAFAKPPEVLPEATEEFAEGAEVPSAEELASAESEELASAESEEAEGGYFYIADNVTVTVGEGGSLICNGVDTGLSEVDFFKASEFITCRNKDYRGAIRLKASNGRILIINVINIEEYLYGVVGKEMSTGFPLEALKAQSVAARNYTVCTMGRHASEGFDLCNGVHCQAYGAVLAEAEDVRQAVDETRGKLLLYRGEAVQCYYYSSNGGYSENSENVWVSEIGYLKGKADPYEVGEEIPGYYWEVSFTPDEIKECLASRGIDIGNITDVRVVEYSDNQHAVKVKITGTNGEKVYTKDNIRAAFPTQLKSTLFTITKGNEELPVKVLSVNGLETRTIKPATVLSANGIQKISSGGKSGEFTISGRGYGHGVGMSQYGAMFMAREGYTFEEILKFYYTDTEISE